MTYIPSPGQVDAFGRLRTSGTGQRLDAEFIFNKNHDLFDEITNNGTVTFNSDSRDLTLSISDANDGTYSKMASYPVPYTPGNSQLIEATGVLDLSNIGSGTMEVFVRSSIGSPYTEETIDQASWLRLQSGVDWSKSHIFFMDFQSLKVGRIRFGLNQSGSNKIVAEISNDNIRNTGYWQQPSLPVFYKLYNDATYTYMEIGYGNDENAIGFRYKITANATATMRAICCTVKSEGGTDIRNLQGVPRAIDRGVTKKTISTTLVPLLSIRPKSTFQGYDNLSLVIPKSFSIDTDNPIKIIIIHNPTLTGASWSDVDSAESSIEYDTSATSYSNGHIVFSDYIASGAKNQESSSAGILGKTVLWHRKGNETGILTIAAVRTTTTSASALAGLNWEEIR